ncbi:MAG: glycoside hydrolase family 26 protein [Thermomicrobiales bacterium]
MGLKRGRFAGVRMLLILVAMVAMLLAALPVSAPMLAQDAADRDVAVQAKRAALKVDPGTALLPESVTIAGSGFSAGAKGKLTLMPGNRALGQIKADKKGRFTRTVSLPDVPSGSYTVTAKAKGKSASAKLKISNPPGGPVALGGFTSGLPSSLGRLDSFETTIGRPVRVVMWFQAWQGGNQTLDITQLNAIASRGAMPMITWEPFDPYGGVDQPLYALDALCSLPGSLTPSFYDPYIDDWATRLANWGKPVLLRFAHEMNGNWYPWAEQVNGNQPGDYIASWNCVRARFAAKGASNVQWVWSPNVDYPGATPFSQVFPGDAAVNWVALDGYNFGTTRPGQTWKSFATIFSGSIHLLDLMSNRPMMIGETASAEQGGSKAGWITDALLRQIPLTFPQVRALVWFNVDKEADWRITSSKSARDAFTAAVNHPYWNATLPAAANGWPVP